MWRRRRRCETSERPIAGLFAAFVPHERRCPCGAEYVGIGSRCRTCTDAELSRLAEAERENTKRTVALEEVFRLMWANLPTGDARRINTLVPRPQIRGLDDAVGAVLAWMAGEGLPWLVLTGPWGVGKSHLAEGAARALVERGERARWQPTVDLLATMRRMVRSDGADHESFLSRVAATPWLVLDDLGRERATDWAQDALYRLVERRQQERTRTLVTTNETKESLGERVGGAIADRVFDRRLTRVVVLQGPSWR